MGRFPVTKHLCRLVPPGAAWCRLVPPGTAWTKVPDHRWGFCLVPPGAAWCRLVPPGAAWCRLVPSITTLLFGDNLSVWLDGLLKNMRAHHSWGFALVPTGASWCRLLPKNDEPFLSDVSNLYASIFNQFEDVCGEARFPPRCLQFVCRHL